MVAMTEEEIGTGWWLRAQVLVTAAAVAIETAAMLSGSSGQIPLAIVCFAVVGSPLAFPRAGHLRAACLTVCGVLLFVAAVWILWVSLEALLYVTPLLIASSALLGIGAPAGERTSSVPLAAGIELAVVAVSVGAALTLIPRQPTVGMLGWGALALLPVVFRDRQGPRIAGAVAGSGLLLVYLSEPAATPVLAAGVAVVLICCGESRTTRAMALLAVGVSWLVPLLLIG